MHCPSCGQENPDGFKFCGNCGAPLAEPAAAEAEERKLVSVLFCDLVGHTAASDRADPEDVRARLRPYHQLLKREIERYGGTVEKFVGDAVMAVFGAPTAHEDDAERAVRSALRILEAVSELELEVRAAVATGEAVVSLAARPEQGEGIVAGDVVNTASRLQNEAAPGTLVVGEVSYRATRDAIEYEELAPVALKGKAEPEPLWRALRPRARFGVDVEASQTTFVGREHDLRLLTDTFERAVREGSTQLVTVVGEPGVGKTRLVAELRAYVDDRTGLFSWRQGRCLPYGEGITFWALGEIVKAEGGILESDSPEQAASKLEAAVAAAVEDPSEHGWFAARLAPLVGAEVGTSGGAIEREESFTAWRRFLEGLAARRPIVIVVEDLHWADVALLEFVEHLVGWGTEVPLMLVCTARPELFDRRPGWGGGRRNSATISLSPLSDEDTARLIAGLLSQAVLPAETQTALLERCGGNPLYAEEFVRMLDDHGIVIRKGAAVELAADGDISVPESVQALIAARLDTLPPAGKALVHDAAVMGKVFWAGAAAAIGGLDERAARERLQELVERGLVRPGRTTSIEHQSEYSFWHVLIRDVAYEQIPRRARLKKHEAAAAWIEEISGDRITDHAEFLAHHYGLALELSRAVGAEEGEARGLETRARRFLVLAGDRATRLEGSAARTYYHRALELYPAEDPERSAVLLKAADAAYQGGVLEDADRLYTEALAEARAHGDRVREGDAGVRLANFIWFRGERERAWNTLVSAVDLLEQEPPGPELARGYAQMGRDHMLAERSSEAVEAAEKALELARPAGLDDLVALALQVRGSSRCSLDELDGLEDLQEARRMALELELGQEVVRSHNNLGSHVCWTEGPAAAHELFQAAVELGFRRGLTSWGRGAKAHTLWTLFDLGRWDELLEVADELVTWDHTHGQTYWGPWGLSYKAHVLVWRGQVPQALGLEDELLARTRDIADPQVLAPALVVSALLEQAQGNHGTALDLVAEFAAITRAPQYRLFCVPDAVRVCVTAGQLGQSRRLLSGEELSAPRFRHALVTSRAVVAEGAGEAEEALALYSDAAGRWASYGFVLEHGQSLLGQARCLIALGRAEEATQPLGEARSLFAQLGAAPLEAEAEGLLATAA